MADSSANRDARMSPGFLRIGTLQPAAIVVMATYVEGGALVLARRMVPGSTIPGTADILRPAVRRRVLTPSARDRGPPRPAETHPSRRARVGTHASPSALGPSISIDPSGPRCCPIARRADRRAPPPPRCPNRIAVPQRPADAALARPCCPSSPPPGRPRHPSLVAIVSRRPGREELLLTGSPVGAQRASLNRHGG